MNRTDQASEPSMEEILASIRHIISDDGRRPSGKDASQTMRMANPPKTPVTAYDGLPEDDVLDLTEELVFPEDQASAPDVIEATYQAQTPPAEENLKEAETVSRFREDERSASAPSPWPESPPAASPVIPSRPDNSRLQRQEAAQRSAPSASRPVWSRRELPNSPPAAPSSVAKQKQETAPAKSQQKNWAEDIQMPVPAQGPVALISSGEKDPRETRKASGSKGNELPPAEAGAPAGDFGDSAPAVAALTDKLARSAAGAMETSELATAREIDFEHLDDERKADVAEKFANAIERQGAAREAGPLPGLLDEVFRQDFIRKPAPEVADAPAGNQGWERSLQATGSSERPETPQSSAQPVSPAARAEQPLEEIARPAVTKTGVLPRKPMETSMPDRPLAQAQFMGAAQSPLSSQGGLTLEEAVREMIRPLLMQWLNENMPRILETAIREEIASRGLLPNSKGS